MELLSPYNAVLNINGSLYLREIMGSYQEGGMRFDNIEILEETNDSIKALVSTHFADGELFYEHTIELEKHNDSWRIDYIEEILGNSITDRDEASWKKLFINYVHNIVRGYIVSENTNCGYNKFSLKTNPDNFPFLEAIDINIIDFNTDNCTGSTYVILDEYDTRNTTLAKHKITVKIGENLSETVIDEIISYNNPTTSASNCGLYIFLIIISLIPIHLIKYKTKKVEI